MSRTTVIFVLSLALANAQEDGEKCTINGSRQIGYCTLFSECAEAKEMIRNRQTPQRCNGFVDNEPIICCPKKISDLKCDEYHKQGFVIAVAGGDKSLPEEFPHMAILGYGPQTDIVWGCGGSLISHEFVLTAAHCINDRTLKTVRWVRLGDLDILDQQDLAQPQDFTVRQTITHPRYRPNSHYHDIALIRLDRKAKFTDYVQPACLHTRTDVPKELIVSGWGKQDYFGESSSHLMKASIFLVDHRTCKSSYDSANLKKLQQGILREPQVCAGHPDGKDTCPGDSGGPLQYSEGVPKYYRIAGVTSFGKGCGVSNSIGVYTRVSHYRKWIEQIVWPQ